VAVSDRKNRLPGGTRTWVPVCCVRLFLEIRAGDEGFLQVQRIFHYRGHHKPRLTGALREQIEILFHYSVAAHREPVLAKVAGQQMSREDLQRLTFISLAGGPESRSRLPDPTLGLLPLRRGVSLAGRRQVLQRLAAEVI
jgi:hypothetical protein